MENQENKILIISGGYVEDAFLQTVIHKEQYTMIIAADNGLMAADRINLTLDFIVGDFDSVDRSVLERYRAVSTPIKTFPTEKDKTDTQIAIELAIMHNPSTIDIIGATGSRFDHVLANIHLLLLPMQLNIVANIMDRNNKIYLTNKDFVIKKEDQFGDYISLLPFGDQVKGLTLKGFKYPLNGITLTSGNSLGISNEIVDTHGYVEVKEGTLIVIEAKD
jgi:thiamine pyrophosphokinase